MSAATLTHQRLVIYEQLMKMGQHTDPEAMYERMRKKIHSLSLATVHNNINIFVKHPSLRLESNLDPHHQLACTDCKAIEDIDDDDFQLIRLKKTIPKGLTMHR